MASFFAVVTFLFFYYPYFGIVTWNPVTAASLGPTYVTHGGTVSPYGGFPWLVRIIGFWIVCACCFTLIRRYLKGKGIDLSAIYKEMPPE